ncbi:MAG: Stk1 family PASTA domain-containing Ser/Thr kinase [Lachnospiraceae bacterium]|nr:Stk1 family PASTA domain-containing Ser/Thr kinase [Lachnospiraceae bacterium]
MIKMGMVIGDRYEVLEKIGTGGMSDVYRAKDEKLSRMVAVKILKQEFSENENFVQKFRTEAQAAAGLMHPNIVNVYDVGDEKGIYYIVMELVDGITLKRYIEEKNRLTVKEAVSISIQVAMGLEAAHNNNIIHRDIKPQNIIISKEGKVKVTDFGIAKAATSNTITSNVMGSVHYTSPEQARGGYSDAMSDIYSLGITMFEMLTGRVPFNGDTTVAIAIKHIQELVQSPRAFVPDIPISVEKIVLKCCQKSPDRRYQTASDLIADLKRSLITPDEDFVQLQDADDERATRVASEEEVRELKENLQPREPAPKKKKPAEVRKGQGKPAQSQGKGRPAANGKKKRIRENEAPAQEKRPQGTVERATMLTALVIAVLVVIILFFAIGSAIGVFGSGGAASSRSDATASSLAGIEVPDVSGQNILYAQAEETLRAQGFLVRKMDDPASSAPKNTVTSQEPAGGSYLNRGETITVYVSTGAGAAQNASTAQSTADDAATSATSEEPPDVQVPGVIGRSEAEATRLLIEAGLRANIIEVHSNETEGTIINQNPPAGTRMAAGAQVNIEKSIGPEVVTYRYSGSIEAPTESEHYVPGMEVSIRFESSQDGVILETTTSAFPYPFTAEHMKSATGMIVMRFQAGDTQQQISRSVEFEREQQ